MASDWFVNPDTKTIQLPGGQWIEVKKRLTVGEERAAFQAIVGEVNSEGWRRPNLEMQGLAEVAAYLVSWSLTNNGQPVKIDTDGLKIAALRGLRPERYKVIEEAVEAHVKAMEAEIEREKNEPAGANVSVPTSLPAA